MATDRHCRGTVEERFWRYVVVPDEPDACWEWTGGHTACGYGSMGTVGKKTGRANRIAYELLVGPIPEGLCVCHHCDNRNCVNPRHLFLGTRADNLHDMFRKGRGGGQFEKGRAPTGQPLKRRWSTAQVSEVKRLLATGMKQADVARRLGMSPSFVNSIAVGRARVDG